MLIPHQHVGVERDSVQLCYNGGEESSQRCWGVRPFFPRSSSIHTNIIRDGVTRSSATFSGAFPTTGDLEEFYFHSGTRWDRSPRCIAACDVYARVQSRFIGLASVKDQLDSN